MATSFLSKVYPLLHTWWIFWSNHRWKDVERLDASIDEKLDDIKLKPLESLDDIKVMTKNMYKKFEWTADGPDQLFDSMCPPPYNYKRVKEGILKDDCDGYHALMYQILHANNIECYLLSVVDWLWGHCILLFKFDGKWHTMDYTSIQEAYDTGKEAIKAYTDDYAQRCRRKYLDTNGLVEYDYEKGKWKNKPIDSLDKQL